MNTIVDSVYSTSSIERLAKLLDNEYKVPGTNWSFGWDFIIGLIPVAGDFLTLLVSCYILLAARKFPIRKSTWVKMGANIMIDFLIGSIPIFGDIFDAAYKANAKNVKLLLAEIEKNQSLR